MQVLCTTYFTDIFNILRSKYLPQKLSHWIAFESFIHIELISRAAFFCMLVLQFCYFDKTGVSLSIYFENLKRSYFKLEKITISFV